MFDTDPNDARRQRGLAIAAVCRIVRKGDHWVVPSQSGNGCYHVNPDPPKCDCPDYEKRGLPCKHVYAVEYVRQRERHEDGSETVSETLTVKRTCASRPTYRQDWPAYHRAQTVEKDRFQVLLHDLCQGVEEPEQERGRPRASLRDMTFAVTFKVYSTVSARRFQCDLNAAAARGHLEKAPHYNTVFKYLEMQGLTAILQRLIVESSLPLQSVETDFAVDSSGFSTSRFVRWFDHKYAKPMQQYDWVKVSLMTGVKTNVVTAAKVDERYAGDCPQFAPLLKATASNFTIDEVSADSAYSSYDNLDAVAGVGALPFIAFKSNATATRGGVYGKMLHFYRFKQDEFLAHYHKRSNSESTFSMIKAKFGDSLRSKTDVAMTNEALCKILCHNLCVLIQSHYELGIEATFWEELLPDVEPKLVGAEDVVQVWDWV